MKMPPKLPFSKPQAHAIRPRSVTRTASGATGSEVENRRPGLDTGSAIGYHPARFNRTSTEQARWGKPGSRAGARSNAELCCVLGFAGNPALPALLGRGDNLAGPSGYWVGHSSGSFAVELLSDREPGLVPGSRGYTRPVSPSFGRGGTTRVQRFMPPTSAGSHDPRRALGVAGRCTPVLFTPSPSAS